MSRILVVEDDFYLRRNLSDILRKNDFLVVTASSVGEAVRYVQTDDEIDLYLLDIWLPDGDGFEICREIRKRNRRPVIFLSVCEDEAGDFIPRPLLRFARFKETYLLPRRLPYVYRCQGYL